LLVTIVLFASETAFLNSETLKQSGIRQSTTDRPLPKPNVPALAPLNLKGFYTNPFLPPDWAYKIASDKRHVTLANRVCHIYKPVKILRKQLSVNRKSIKNIAANRKK
jgi:hypothetical protein